MECIVIDDVAGQAGGEGEATVENDPRRDPRADPVTNVVYASVGVRESVADEYNSAELLAMGFMMKEDQRCLIWNAVWDKEDSERKGAPLPAYFGSEDETE